MINNNRQAGRRRGRGGQQQRPQGNSGRQDTGNRIDNRSRGNAAQLLEKSKALARDSQMSGDRVNTEYYLQFADHYFRVLAETRSRLEENNRPPIQGGANTFQDDEQDYDDEGEPVARAEQPRQNEGRPDANRQDGNRADGNRQDGNRQQNGNQSYQSERQGRDSQDRPQGYQDRQQQDRAQGNQERPQQERAPRAERPHYDDERPRRQNGSGNDQAPDRYVRDANRGNRERYQPEESAPVQQDVAPVAEEAPRIDVPPVADEQPQQEAPRRRGRPRREPVAEAPAAFEADRLPPSLNISAVTPVAEAAPANDVGGDEPEEKPRRRGRPPAASKATIA